MKNLYQFAIIGFSAVLASAMISCSDDKDEPDNKDPEQTYVTTTIGFENVPEYLIASDSYGTNLYYGSQDQITTGYLAKLSGDTYAQFSINYGKTYDAAFNSVWGYSFYQGGIAISKYHDMTVNTYENQLSVYNVSSPSGGNFAVAFGNSDVVDPTNATLSQYSDCAKVYITNAQGYSVKNQGQANSYVTGEDKDAFFESVWINNTTYDFLVMQNGNNYASALNEANKGWFKIQFIAFEDNDQNSKALGCVEAYLANFDENLADGYLGIIDTWTKVDLSSLPECSVLVINFVGSDTGEYGLNTPTYCALDKFEISVEK